MERRDVTQTQTTLNLEPFLVPDKVLYSFPNQTVSEFHVEHCILGNVLTYAADNGVRDTICTALPGVTKETMLNRKSSTPRNT